MGGHAQHLGLASVEELGQGSQHPAQGSWERRWGQRWGGGAEVDGADARDAECGTRRASVRRQSPGV